MRTGTGTTTGIGKVKFSLENERLSGSLLPLISSPNYKFWLFLVLMPVAIVAGSCFVIAPLNFDTGIFLSTAILCVFLCTASTLILSKIVRRSSDRYPEASQTPRRFLAIIPGVAFFTITVALAHTGIYHLFPHPGMEFGWPLFSKFLVLWFVANLLLTGTTSLIYILEKWKQNLADEETLKREALHLQISEVRELVKPDFLFQTLDWLSALIEKAPEEAETFVDDLAMVYRYILQSSNTDLVKLSDEIQFTKTYIRLLRPVYGKALQTCLPGRDETRHLLIPPVMLQNLLNSAIHNYPSRPPDPLNFTVRMEPFTGIVVSYNSPRESTPTRKPSLELRQILDRYRSLGITEIPVSEQHQFFSAVLPWLDMSTEDCVA